METRILKRSRESLLSIQGVGDELKFWMDFVHTDQFKSWIQPGVPAPELAPEVVEKVKQVVDEYGSILDVGSGAASILTGIVPYPLLHATDLLAELYHEFFDYSEYPQISVPFPFSVEHDLREAFGIKFRLVHMRNALDHAQDPNKGFWNLLNAGEEVIISGFRCEGEYLHGLGMHQWNLDVVNGELCIGARGGLLYPIRHKNLENVFSNVTMLPNGRGWFNWIGRFYDH